MRLCLPILFLRLQLSEHCDIGRTRMQQDFNHQSVKGKQNQLHCPSHQIKHCLSLTYSHSKVKAPGTCFGDGGVPSEEHRETWTHNIAVPALAGAWARLRLLSAPARSR